MATAVASSALDYDAAMAAGFADEARAQAARRRIYASGYDLLNAVRDCAMLAKQPADNDNLIIQLMDMDAETLQWMCERMEDNSDRFSLIHREGYKWYQLISRLWQEAD